jgi:hypothetical protein
MPMFQGLLHALRCIFVRFAALGFLTWSKCFTPLYLDLHSAPPGRGCVVWKPRSSAARRRVRLAANTKNKMVTTATTTSPKAPKRDHLVLPPRFSRRILLASSLMLLSCATAVHNGLMDNALLALLVFCSSINYWRYPIVGWRRSVDMCCACGSLAYQVFYTSRYTTSRARLCYVGTVALGGLFYSLARALNRTLGAIPGRRDLALNISSACHVALHVCGNVGNLILYDALGTNWMRWEGGGQGAAQFNAPAETEQ